ncbi:MAG: hypothetical protein N2037_12240 [Acidimicrobiales bacterium]|nr:hypothetical protein [Acidimicrobiales bacterium]
MSPSTVATAAGGPTAEVPRFASLDVDPVVECVGPASVEIDVAYEASGAERVIFLVDDVQVPGTLPPIGTARVPIECDGSVHVLVATAVAADGRTGVESKAIQTDTELEPEPEQD